MLITEARKVLMFRSCLLGFLVFGNKLNGLLYLLQVLPLLLQSMSALCHENMQSDILLSILLVLSALLVDRNGKQVCSKIY